MGIAVRVVQHGDKVRQPGDPGLTELGQAQADAAAVHLATLGAVGAIWSSPLRRARQTAQPIAAALGLSVTVDDRLRERMNWAGDDAQPLEAFLAEWRHASTDRDFRPHSGQSSNAAAARFLAALDDLRGHEGAAVVVAHGGVTVDALRTLLGDGEVRRRAPTVIDEGIPSGAITTLQAADEGWQVVAIAETGHVEQGSSHRPG